jgi:hypothetical protein
MSQPAVVIEWDVRPLPDTKHPSETSASGSTSFRLDQTQTAKSEDAVEVYNTTDSAYYTALLTSLSEAKDGLNSRLTDWKDVIGDKEKSKEVLPPGAVGKKGMGKAMMMVQAAKETDGRGSAKEGLPTDDQESDEDSDGEIPTAD